MINALETATSQLYSFAVRRQAIARDALTFFPTAKVRDGAPDASYRPPLPSPDYFGRLNRINPERMIVQGSSGPEPAATAAAVSQAQSVVAARVGDTPVEAAINKLPPSRSKIEISTQNASGTNEKGYEFPKLDASWKVIPTARFAADVEQGMIELRV